MAASNPFRPTYGKSPPVLAGRDEQLALISDALDEGAGAPARSALLIGQRGMGKTVMLNHVEDLARQRGWWVISETAHGGLVARIVNDHLVPALRELDDEATVTRLTSISAPLGLGGVSWATEQQLQRMAGLRSLLTRLSEVCGANGAGVMVTLDEIQGGSRDELREVTTVFQHMVREDREFACAAAGLPAAINQHLLQDKVLTFLRRAEHYHLGPVPPDEAGPAIAIPIRDGGRDIEPDALELAVEMSSGYPYLIQLVGYHSWRQRPDSAVIARADVERAFPAVRDRLWRQVIEPELADLSARDRQFIAAMGRDTSSSRIADIAERMGVDGNYANQYRLRLLSTELIAEDGRGRLRLTQPGLRSYLNAHPELQRSAEPDDDPNGLDLT